MTRLVRDRLTWLVYGQLGLYGYFLYGFGPVVPLLRVEQGTSRTLAGLHGTALAAGAVLTGAVFPAVVRRAGRGGALWLGVTGLVAGVLLLVLGRALPVTLTATLLASVGGSLVVNASTPVLADHHGPAGPAAISEANAVAAGMGLLAPLAVGGAVGAGWGWRPGLAVTVLLAAALAAVAWRHRIRVPRLAVPAGGAPARLPRRYWGAWGVLVAVIAVEFSVTLWASDELAGRRGMAPAIAATAVTAVVAGMLAGRLVGGRLELRHPPRQLLLGALALCGLGFAVFWTAPWAWLAFLGLAVTGLGISLHFPLGISLAIAAADGATDLATARASYAAGLAVGVAPLALGALADRVGVHLAFLLVPVLLAIAAAGVRRAHRGPVAQAVPAGRGGTT